MSVRKSLKQNLPSIHDGPGTAPFSIAWLAVLTAVAFGLRFWHTDVPFHSGDFATMPYLATYSSGFGWVAAHSYGPLLPGLVFVFSRVVLALGGVMTETLWRLPLVVIGALHVPITHALMRRLGAARWTCILAAAVAAVSPALVNDARYPWGYESLGTVLATAALWAWLRALDLRNGRAAWLAGSLTAACLLSHLTIHALPVLLMAAAIQSAGLRQGLRRLIQPAMSLSIACAVAITLICFVRFDGGIVARMLKRADDGVVSVGASTLTDLLSFWTEHLGPPWTALSMAGIALGMIRFFQGDRRGLPALWALAHSLPLIAFVNPAGIGRAASYHVQGSFAAALCVCLLLEAALGERHRAAQAPDWSKGARLVAPVRIGTAFTVLVAICAVALLGLGTVSNLLAHAQYPFLSGTTDYGAPRPDPGYKAAGWYIRTQVPQDAVILAMHCSQGLEYPCAMYYLGRHVAATEDSTLGEQERILRAVADRVDVIVADASLAFLLNQIPGMAMTSRVTRNDKPILFIWSRSAMRLPSMTIDVASANSRFDRECAPRRLPVVVARNSRTSEINRIIRGLRSSATSSAKTAGVTQRPGRSSPD